MTPYNPSAQHIVLDLETLSTKPNAAVISIGAVALDSEGNFLGEFHQALKPDQPGRDIDQATVQWWESQSAEAQEASYKAKDTVTATVGMYMFSAWICCVGSPDEVKMWGNGSSFDCTILSSLYDQSHELRHPKPWAWWNDRDMRTLLDAFPAAKDVGEFVGVKHHALHDARHEAKQLAKALRLMAAAKVAQSAPVQMPVVPTMQMLMALMSPGEKEVMASSPSETFALMLMDRAGIRERYSAMLAASPTPPAEQQAAPKAAPGEPSAFPMTGDEEESDLGQWQPGTAKPNMDGTYLREFDEGEATSEFHQGVWLRDGFFPSDLQDVRWRGRAAPQQEPSRDAKTWCSYVAGMIGCYLKKPDESAEVRAIAGIIERRLWALPAPQPAPAPLSDDAERDAAFEAVRKKLCALPRFSFLSDGYGVRRVPDKSGSWIAFDAAHAMFDPVAVDAALATQGGE